MILFVALIVLGPDKLPEAAKKLGGFIGEMRRISSGFQDELRSAAMIDDKSVEQGARKRGEKAVADSKQAQNKSEPAGTPLSENNEPFVNTDNTDNTDSSENSDKTDKPATVDSTFSEEADADSGAADIQQVAPATPPDDSQTESDKPNSVDPVDDAIESDL